MRQLIKQRDIINDTWKYVDEDATAVAVIIPLARFQQERDQWLTSTAILGVRLAPTDDVDALQGDL
ncbi:MAG: oxidoreductase, partial [Candidatus Obscuribacterales bacterium]|nr:oxidoreductase [Steroidobacteraceae bacterium]